MSAVTTDSTLVPQATKRRTVALLSMGHGAAHWYTGLYSVILPVIAQTLGLSYTQVGVIASVRGMGSSLSSIAGGVLADTTDRRKTLLVLCLITTAIAHALLGSVSSFGGVLILLTLGVLGNATWHPLAMPVLTYLYPRRMGLSLGLHDGGAQIVQAISPLIVGWALTFVLWRRVLHLHLLPGLIMAGLLWLALPHIQIATREGRSRFRERLRSDLLGNARMWVVSTIWTLTGMAREGITTFLPLFVAFELGLSSVWVGAYVASVTLAGAMTAPAAGWLGDKAGHRTILLVGMLGGAGLLLLLPRAPSGLPLMMVTALLGLFVFSSRSLLFASAMGATSTDVGGSTIGLMFFLNRGASAIAPLLSGWLAERYGLAYVFYFLGSLILLAGLLTSAFLKPGEST
ncbi:MAG: MFS transporter [Anaerolineae bacterium]